MSIESRHLGESRHFCIVRFPGTNRERDLQRALGTICERGSHGSEVTIIDSEDRAFPSSIDAIFLCGGFAWGDYLRAGACAAHARIIPSLRRHASAGTLIIGICNGFQILTEMGLLEGALQRNSSGRFVCRWQELDFTGLDFTGLDSTGLDSTGLDFASNGRNEDTPPKDTLSKRLLLPIAHSDGRYVAHEDTLERLESDARIFLRYASWATTGSPNGSLREIAGICDTSRRIFGLMPHPENAIEPFHTSRDGLVLLGALLDYGLGCEGRIAA